MRFIMLALAAAGIALAVAAGGADIASAEKTKMGCDKATEMWDASQGRCVPGQSKWRKPPAPQPVAAPVPPKKAPAKKAAAKKGKAPAKKQ